MTDERYEPAERVTLTIDMTIRPSYADADTVKDEIEQSLEWLVSDHNAVKIHHIGFLGAAREDTWDYGPEDGEQT